MFTKGVYIGFSGVDGCGKTTIIDNVCKRIANSISANVVQFDAMKPCFFTSQLKEASKIIGINMFDAFNSEFINASYSLDLLYNYEYKIKPSLNNGSIVVTHRNVLCCRSYSEIFTGNIELVDKILSLAKQPDLLFYLDVDYRIALERIKERNKIDGENISEKENAETIIKAIEIYNKLIKEVYKDTIIINANFSAQEVSNTVYKYINDYISKYKR